MLTLEQKKAIVAEVNGVARTALSAIAAEYRGLGVDAMTRLRKEARDNDVYLRVVKNSLARRAVEGTDFACMKEAFVGPLVIAFARNDPSSVARIARDFAKGNDKFVVKAVALSGRLLPASEIERLAKMPTRDQAISLLMAVMKAPIEKFVRTLAAPHTKLVRTVAAIRDDKQQAGVDPGLSLI